MDEEAIFVVAGRIAWAVLEVLALLPPAVRPVAAATVLANTAVASGWGHDQVVKLVEEALQAVAAQARAEAN